MGESMAGAGAGLRTCGFRPLGQGRVVFRWLLLLSSCSGQSTPSITRDALT